jgi:peptidase C39-like protein
MRKRYNFLTPADYFKLKRTTQISESHCGPATIQMLLSNLGSDLTQEQIAEAGDATELIEQDGMRVDQLARAVVLLASHVEFWYKENAMLGQLVSILTEHHYPVGVEWQGIFDDDEDDTSSDNDFGHYSVIAHVDLQKQELIVVDPYKDFVSRDRIISFEDFETRWWDYNAVMDVETGKQKFVKDNHLMFIIVPEGTAFPAALGMTRV